MKVLPLKPFNSLFQHRNKEIALQKKERGRTGKEGDGSWYYTCEGKGHWQKYQHWVSRDNRRNIQILKSQINTSLGEWVYFFTPFFHLIAFSRPPPMVIIHCSLSLLWLIRANSGSPGIRAEKRSGVFSVINTVSVLLRIERRRESSRWYLAKLLIWAPAA